MFRMLFSWETLFRRKLMMGVSEELCADPAIAVLRKNKKAEDQKTMTKSNNGLRKYVPATPPPPSRDSLSALTMAAAFIFVMSFLTI